MQLIVLGMHRSGTSTLARILNLMGAYFGPEHMMLPADQHNPRGYWERADVIGINEQILSLSGGSWYCPSSFDIAATSLPEANRRTMEHLVLGLDAHRPWFIKDPRLCLTWPHWSRLCDLPICVLCARHPLSVAASLSARNRMPRDYALALWEYYAAALLRGAYAYSKVFVEYEALLQNPLAHSRQLYEQLVSAGVVGLRPLGEQELCAFFQQRPVAAPEQPLSPQQSHLYAMIKGEHAVDINIQPSEQARRMLASVRATRCMT